MPQVIVQVNNIQRLSFFLSIETDKRIREVKTALTNLYSHHKLVWFPIEETSAYWSLHALFLKVLLIFFTHATNRWSGNKINWFHDLSRKCKLANVSELTFWALALCQRAWSNSPTDATTQFLYKLCYLRLFRRSCSLRVRAVLSGLFSERQWLKNRQIL